MRLIEEIKKIADGLPAKITESKGIFGLEYVVAERKAFLSKKKLIYIAKFRIAEDKKEMRFSEMLKETGLGIFTGGDSDMSPGFGFKAEKYKTGTGPREGTIEEQSNLLGKKYNYTFDFGKFREQVKRAAADAGYEFKYEFLM
jgi:hypothetical protein